MNDYGISGLGFVFPLTNYLKTDAGKEAARKTLVYHTREKSDGFAPYGQKPLGMLENLVDDLENNTFDESSNYGYWIYEVFPNHPDGKNYRIMEHDSGERGSVIVVSFTSPESLVNRLKTWGTTINGLSLTDMTTMFGEDDEVLYDVAQRLGYKGEDKVPRFFSLTNSRQ